MDDLLREKLGGLGEAVMGSALASLPFWSRMLDSVVYGAHFIASLGGAVLAIHGIWRIIKKRHSRFNDSMDRR